MILVMISRNNATVKVPSPGLSATLKAILFLVGIVVPGVILLGLGSASKDTKLTGFAIVEIVWSLFWGWTSIRAFAGISKSVHGGSGSKVGTIFDFVVFGMLVPFCLPIWAFVSTLIAGAFGIALASL